MSDAIPPPPPQSPSAAPSTPPATPSAGAPPPLPPPQPSDLPARVSGLACPSCAGALEVETGVRVLVCPYCDTSLLAVSELGLRRFAVEPKLGLEAAREAARGWLGRGWHKDRRLAEAAELGESFLCFLPFFRVEADVVGVALGTEERRRTTGSGKRRRTETYEVDVERTVERHFDRTFAAVNVAELGVWRVDLRGDRLLPFDPSVLERLGMIFPPTRSEAEVRRSALDEVRQEADPGKGLKRVRFRFVDTVREMFTAVYYPLWVVRYRFENRAYLVVVDGEDGEVAYGKAPGNDFYRALMMVATEAVVCFAATTVVRIADDVRVMLAVAAIGAVAVAWAWKKFRYGGVVEEGTGHREKAKGLGSMLGAAAKKGFRW
jgi:uncharacterized protein YbaR (Trm112 family)